MTLDEIRPILEPITAFVQAMDRDGNRRLTDDVVVAPVWDYHGRSRLTLGHLRKIAAAVAAQGDS